MNYKKQYNVATRSKYSYKTLSKGLGLIPVVIESSDYDISQFITSSSKKWICREYYEKTELGDILLDILKNVFINNISLNPNEQIEFMIGSYKFPLKTKLEDIYPIYKDSQDDILYLLLIKTNVTFLSKCVNFFRKIEYNVYYLKNRIFSKRYKEYDYESPYTEI